MSMEVRVQLVHADGQVRVVLVSAYSGERLLGSALGDAADAEAAEDRALERLLARLAAGPLVPESATGISPATHPGPTPGGPRTARFPDSPAAATPPPRAVVGSDVAVTPVEAPATSAAAPPPEPATEPQADPEDWSSELLRLDRELQRLQWGRAEEEVYLQRAFGHPSRNRLTSYADLLANLRTVEALNPPADPAAAAVPMRRQDLLNQCDDLLRQLNWPREKARQFLESQLKVTSRQQLSDQDLLQFNLLLEGELLAAGA